MRSAKIFLAGMYLHLILSIVTPIMILVFNVIWDSDIWNSAARRLAPLYLGNIGVVHLLGWVCVVIAVTLRRRQPEKLRQGWRLLKLWSIPFYILNFVYSCLAWFLLLAASRGILFFLLPLPVLTTCLMIFQSGCVGICYLTCLRRQPEHGDKPSGIHFLLQLIPVADVVSTIVLLRRYPAVKSR